MNDIPTNPIFSGNRDPLRTSLVTKEEVAQFQAIAFREYGVRLTDTQAYEQATALITLFDTLLKQHLAFGHQNDMMTDR